MLMQVSLNEAESMVRKAFRGAGYHWGEAEEAGKAVVWLARRGLPAIAPVLPVLDAGAGNPAALRPSLRGGTWNGAKGNLCPVLSGIALADGAVALAPELKLRFEGLLSPVLLLPFLVAAAQSSGLTLSLDWPQGKAFADAVGVTFEGEGLLSADATLQATLGVHPQAPHLAASLRVLAVEPDQWEALNRYAAQTYVPASERSRTAGAGAGLADND